MRTHFITYGDHKYTNSKRRISTEAAAFGFTDVHVFGPDDITPAFVSATGLNVTHRGGGWWLWKVDIVNQILDHMAMGDIGVYCDAGCMVVNEPREHQRWDEYRKMLDTQDMIVFDMDTNPECQYTKREVFDYFHIPLESSLFYSPQICATFYIFKKTPHILHFFRRYYEIAIDNPKLFNDDFGPGQHSRCKETRHDQSVFSLMVKTSDKIQILSLDDRYNPFKQSRIRN